MITPAFTGQYYRDTATGNIWKSNSTTPGDWTLVVQDMQVRWTPTSIKMGELFSWLDYTTDCLPGILTAIFNQESFVDAFDLEYIKDVTTISFPNATSFLSTFYLSGAKIQTVSFGSLVSTASSFKLDVGGDLGSVITVDLLQTIGGVFEVITQTGLIPGSGDMTLNANSLTSVSGNMLLWYLASINLPNLVNVGGQWDSDGSSRLTSVSFPNFLPTNTKNLDFSGCALDLTSVDHILARCVANAAYVSGTVNVSGGTSAAPTQGAGSAHDILVARGVTVTHN